MTKSYTLYQDPAHSWLRVPKDEIHDLQIHNNFTTFSYQDDRAYYLEEHADTSVFTNALRYHGITLAQDQIQPYYAPHSPVRQMDSVKHSYTDPVTLYIVVDPADYARERQFEANPNLLINAIRRALPRYRVLCTPNCLNTYSWNWIRQAPDWQRTLTQLPSALTDFIYRTAGQIITERFQCQLILPPAQPIRQLKLTKNPNVPAFHNFYTGMTVPLICTQRDPEAPDAPIWHVLAPDGTPVALLNSEAEPVP